MRAPVTITLKIQFLTAYPEFSMWDAPLLTQRLAWIPHQTGNPSYFFAHSMISSSPPSLITEWSSGEKRKDEWKSTLIIEQFLCARYCVRYLVHSISSKSHKNSTRYISSSTLVTCWGSKRLNFLGEQRTRKWWSAGLLYSLCDRPCILKPLCFIHEDTEVLEMATGRLNVTGLLCSKRNTWAQGFYFLF